MLTCYFMMIMNLIQALVLAVHPTKTYQQPIVARHPLQKEQRMTFRTSIPGLVFGRG